MKQDKVLLLELRERTSAKGNAYMSGWLGKAAVVAFSEDREGETIWKVYVSTPNQSGREARAQPPRQRQYQRAGLDDDISDIGR